MDGQSKSVSRTPALFAIAGLVVLGLVISQKALFRADQYAPAPAPLVATRFEAREMLAPEPPALTVYIVRSAKDAEELAGLLAQQQVTVPPAGGYSIAVAESAETLAAVVAYLHGNAEPMPHVLAFFGDETPGS